MRLQERKREAERQIKDRDAPARELFEINCLPTEKFVVAQESTLGPSEASNFPAPGVEEAMVSASSTAADIDVLPHLDFEDDEFCRQLNVCTRAAADHGTPGEGSAEWEAHIRAMAIVFPNSVVREDLVDEALECPNEVALREHLVNQEAIEKGG